MRRLAVLLALSPLACAPQSSDTRDPPPADTASKAPSPDEPNADQPPNEGGAPDDPAARDCIKTTGLPPGTIPESVAQWAELDLSVLEAALPKDPRDPDLANTETSPWKRGAAGHASPLVMRAIHPPGASTTIVSITDLQHVCYCGEGMGQRLHDAAKAEGDASEKIDERVVAVKSKKTVTDLRVWVGDRCEFLIRSPSRAEADALFRATDWAALDKTCSARDALAQ
jgi:hypothetical protein